MNLADGDIGDDFVNAERRRKHLVTETSLRINTRLILLRSKIDEAVMILRGYYCYTRKAAKADAKTDGSKQGSKAAKGHLATARRYLAMALDGR